MSMKKHAVSGCDTVSSCLGHEKKSAWLAWISCPSAIDAFLDISLQPVDVSSETLEGIEVHSCRVQLNVFSQWSMERVVGTGFSDNGEHPTKPKRHSCNMCDERHSKRGMCGRRRLLRSLSCLVLHFGGGSHIIRGGNPFGLN